MFRVSKPTGTYLRAVLKMSGPAQNDAWHDAPMAAIHPLTSEMRSQNDA